MPDHARFSRVETFIALAFLIAFCIYFFPSSHQEIRIHDTFDGNFSTRHVLVNSGHFFDTNPNSTVPGIMNGLPRGVFPKFTEITSLLMWCFGSLNGFALGFILARLIGFIGIYLFGRDHVTIRREQRGLLFLIATCFACLPIFVIHGITVLGLPLVLWAFLNLLKKKELFSSYFVFALFPLWSNFVLVGLHLTLALGAIAVYYSFSAGKILWPLFKAITLMFTVYLLSEYMLFYLHYFNPNYHSSRGELEKHLGLNLNGVIGGTFRSFFTGDFSTAGYFGYLLLPFIGYYSFKAFKERKTDPYNLGLVFLSMLFTSSVIINLLDWKSFAFFYEKFTFAKVFNFQRFTSILPGLFFLTALLSLIRSNEKQNNLIRIASTLTVSLLLVFIWRGNISHGRSAFNTTGLKIISEQQITFEQFFDPELFIKIKKEIGADTVNNVIQFGLSPSPSKYAGLKVLDDYQGDYPNEYKAEFRKIIADELEKSTPLKNYFDGWGARCYLESARSFENNLEQKNGLQFEPELKINASQLKVMNCHYIISSILIGNAEQLGLKLQKVLVSTIDRKTILLYKIT